MNAGILRHKIDIEQELLIKNTYGESTQTWVIFKSGVFCSVEPIRGREYFAADEVKSEVTHRIRMRYLFGMRTKMRIKYNNRYFNIIDIIDIMERHKEMQLMVTEVV